MQGPRRRREGSALRLFGRMWHCSGEDLALPSAMETVPNLAVLLLFLVLLATYPFDVDDCASYRLLVYTIVSAALHGTLVTLNVVQTVAACSMQWMRPAPTAAPLFYTRLAVLVAQCVWAVYGLVVSIQQTAAAEQQELVDSAFTFVVIFNLVDVAFTLCCGCCAFRSFGARPEGRGHQEWANCCKTSTVLCSCLEPAVKMDDDDMMRVAQHLWTFFQDVSGFVLSDVVAGLVLLHAYQKQNHVFAHDDHRRPSSAPSDADTLLLAEAPHDLRFKQAIYFARYAAGAYGAGIYTIEHPIRSCLLCFTCLARGDTIMEGSDCCLCSTSAFRRQAGIASTDIVFASHVTAFSGVVFYVALDRQQQSIVVAIRGTFSRADIATDLDADLIDLAEVGIDNEGHTHRGFAQCCRYIHAKLEEHEILHQLVHKYPQYTLHIVGHSLGASVATLLGLLLSSSYPSLHVFAYGSPPSLSATVCAEEWVQGHVTSIIVGRDMVPQLSLPAVHMMKAQVLALIDAYLDCTDKPRKWSILRSVGCCSSTDLASFVTSQHVMESMSRIENPHPQSTQSLSIPGRIYYVDLVREKRQGCRTSRRRPRLSRYVLPQNTIRLSSHMWFDHFPHLYKQVLESME